MGKYVNADTLLRQTLSKYGNGMTIYDLGVELDTMPGINITFCKDCEYGDIYCHDKGKLRVWCDMNQHDMPLNGFCSDGGKRHG